MIFGGSIFFFSRRNDSPKTSTGPSFSMKQMTCFPSVKISTSGERIRSHPESIFSQWSSHLGHSLFPLEWIQQRSGGLDTMDNINYSAPPINEDPRLDDDLRKVAIAHPQKKHLQVTKLYYCASLLPSGLLVIVPPSFRFFPF